MAGAFALAFGSGRRKVSPILRPHVAAGVRQAVRDLRRRRDRLGGGAAAAASAAAIRRASSPARRSTSSFRRCSFAPAPGPTSRASTRASSSPSSCRRSSSMLLVYASAAPRSPRRRRRAGGAERSRDHRLVRQRRADRHPARRRALRRERAGAARHARQPARADPADDPDRAGRARPRPHANGAPTPGGAHLLGTLATTAQEHGRPPGRAAGARRPGVERVGLAAADLRRRDPGHARPGRRAALPGADRRFARALRRSRRAARGGGPLVPEAGRPAARWCSRSRTACSA